MTWPALSEPHSSASQESRELPQDPSSPHYMTPRLKQTRAAPAAIKTAEAIFGVARSSGGGSPGRRRAPSQEISPSAAHRVGESVARYIERMRIAQVRASPAFPAWAVAAGLSLCAGRAGEGGRSTPLLTCPPVLCLGPLQQRQEDERLASPQVVKRPLVVTQPSGDVAVIDRPVSALRRMERAQPKIDNSRPVSFGDGESFPSFPCSALFFFLKAGLVLECPEEGDAPPPFPKEAAAAESNRAQVS